MSLFQGLEQHQMGPPANIHYCRIEQGKNCDTFVGLHWRGKQKKSHEELEGRSFERMMLFKGRQFMHT